MASNKERFADKMEFPPEIQQPNIYPLSWNSKTKKLQEVWEASLRENWDPEKLPWDTLDVDSYTWEERESIAYWWSLLSVFDASAPPVFAEALIKTYEVHEEDPVRKCFFSVTRDEQNHEIMCGLAITKLLGHPDPITYEPKTDLGRRLQKNVKWLYFNGSRYWTGYKQAVPKYDLAVLFSSFLMGEIAAATIFKQMFDKYSKEAGKEQYLIPYFIAAHPGTQDEDMLNLALWLKKNNFGLDEENLYVASVFVGDGLRIKRFTPKAFGRATPIIRRSSNVKIVLEEREEGKNRRVVDKQEIVTVKDEAGLEEVVSTKEEKKIGSDERKKDVKPQAVRAVKKVFQRKAA